MCRGLFSKVFTRWRPRLLVALVVLGLTPRMALAQYNTAEVSGVVIDVQGSVISGASVVALHLVTGLTIERVTDAQGRFFLPALPVSSTDNS